MKKVILFSLTLALLCGAASCSEKAPSGAETTRSDSSENDNDTSKTELIVAALPPTNDTSVYGLEELVKSFNARSEKYTAVIREYSSADGDPYEGLNRLNMDILAGDPPDVIAAPPESTEKLKKHSYLTDLFPLMDGSDEISRSDFLPNVLPALEENDTLPAIFFGFKLKTMAVRTDSLAPGMESWTYEDMEEVYSSMPAGKRLFDEANLSREQALGLIYLPCLADSYIDFDRSSCDFSGLIPRLEFLSSLQDGRTASQAVEGMSEQEYKVWRDEEALALIRGNALVGAVEMGGLNATVSAQLAYFGDTPLTFIGYPSENGGRTVTTVDTMYSVMQNSGNKDAAWELIAGGFRKSRQTEMSISLHGLPVTAEAMEALTSSDITLTQSHSSVYAPVHFSEDREPYVIKDEKIEQLRQFIASAKISPYTHTDVDSILFEDCMSALNGERSAEQCADILTNRISTYLSENS